MAISTFDLCFEEYKIRQLNASQRIAVDRSGINADFIGLHKWFFKWRVAEDYTFAEIIFGRDKFTSNPQQVFSLLGFQRHPGTKAGMHENEFFGLVK